MSSPRQMAAATEGLVQGGSEPSAYRVRGGKDTLPRRRSLPLGHEAWLGVRAVDKRERCQEKSALGGEGGRRGGVRSGRPPARPDPFVARAAVAPRTSSRTMSGQTGPTA